jgi:hypothetical protein
MKVHFISPFSCEKNIGKAINEAIEQLDADDEDWIVHNDQDVLWLRSDSKRQLIEILSNTDYDLLGCLTNRLANYYQLVANTFNEDSISKHIEVANIRHEAAYGEVRPYNQVLAAFCLCFKVKTWKLLGGFTENNIVFDTNFCSKAQQAGLKSGLMTGIYLLHLYRYGSQNPKGDIKHLLP